jgi:hypothetical protein
MRVACHDATSAKNAWEGATRRRTENFAIFPVHARDAPQACCSLILEYLSKKAVGEQLLDLLRVVGPRKRKMARDFRSEEWVGVNLG